MEEIRDALLRMVKGARGIEDFREACLKVGLKEDSLFECYGLIQDAIYILIGERTETINDSVTHLALTAPFLTSERRTEILLSEYKKNHSMPRPNTMEPDAMRKMQKENGGYQTPEGEWR